MKKTKEMQQNRNYPLLIVLLFYFVPVSVWIFYTYHYSPLAYSWAIAVVGIAIVCMGSALLFTLMRSIEEDELQPATVRPSLSSLQEIPTEVIDTLKASFEEEKSIWQKQIEEMQQQLRAQTLALGHAREELDKVNGENSTMTVRLKNLHEENALKEEEKVERMEELGEQLNHKQLLIQQLENQINDLRYEIKTLLQLTEVDYRALDHEFTSAAEAPEELPPLEGPQRGLVKTDEEALKLLKRCLDIAQKMSSGYRPSTLRHIVQDPYVFDMRRLKDSLKWEEGAMILVYSPKEERILFANKETKTLLGWGIEKFAKDFAEIAVEGLSVWKAYVAELVTKSEVSFALECKAKNGNVVKLRMILAPIPTGAFRSLVIAVGYTNADNSP